MDLDELLGASAPPISTRTPELERELNDLMAAYEAAQSRVRRPARVALVGGTLAAILGIGAVASATGVLPGWPSFSTSSGQTCSIEISVHALEPGEGEQPIASSFTAGEKREALAAAQTFLGDFDYDAVDRGEAIAWWKGEESEARASQADPAERQPKLTGNDLEVTAVSQWVLHELRTELAVQGLDIQAIGVGTSIGGCDL